MKTKNTIEPARRKIDVALRPVALCPVFRESEEAPQRTNPVANLFNTITAQKTSTTMTSIAGLSRLLECPVCGDYALPPILQCENGHHLYTRCRQKVARCPICLAPKEAARQARLTAHGCATLYSAVETDVAANPAGWDRNSGGPGSGHDPRGPHPVGLVPEPSLGYCTWAGAAHQASSSDLGGATGTGPWTGPPGL
ncbi:hypothetical protein MTO96_017117 [Rhipicephalus appendiculatus]